MSVAVIQVDDLTMRYAAGDGTPAVDGVDLAVHRGEVFAILGPNGAGKSTLLRLLTTLVEPSSGTFQIAGMPPSEGVGIRAAVGLVAADERSFFWRLSGRENLLFYAALWGLSRPAAERRLDQLADELELHDILPVRVDRCSTGMKHRLALARALLHDPEILLLDEPTRSLDPMVAASVRATLRRLASEAGKTLLLVTHDPAEAAALADRVAIMWQGQLREVPDPKRLVELFDSSPGVGAESEDAAWERLFEALAEDAPATRAAADPSLRPSPRPARPLAILGAFLRRDVRIHLSYRFALALELVGVALSVATFYFVGRLVGEGGPHLAPYGGSYFPFALVGLAFFSFQSVALGQLSSAVRQGQVTGTLEAMLATSARLPVLLAGSTLWPFVLSGLRAGLFLAVGALGFGMTFGGANLFATALFLLLMVSATAGIGLLSAAFVVVFKRGDPIQFAIAALSTLLSGVYFPVSLLPAPLRVAADFLPLTFALEALRGALLRGEPVAALGGEALALVVFTLILVPIGLAAFARAVRQAKRAGTLAQY